MITARIPQAIRIGSPVLWRISPPDADPVSVAAVVVHIHGDGALAVSARHGGVLFDDDGVKPADVELIISGPTGAAHLAWWLRDQPMRDPETVRADLTAVGTFAGAVIDVIVRAADGSTLFPRELELLRDYAHHIAGVKP